VNGELETLKDALPYLVPLLVLEIVLLFVAIIDLDRRRYVTGGNKLVWVLVIVIISIIGPVIYFVFGRRKKVVDTK
jgi:hypothetical protein